MCGIFGAIRKQGTFGLDAFESFKELTDLVKYRGPDDSGYLPLTFSPDSSPDPTSFQVFLGHRRLSIIDLSSAGHQPMTDGNGLWIIFNGEIFNYVELRNELKVAGHIFKTETDTEVILHIYQEYGERGFEKLNGMWAFAIADLPAQRIVLSRDRFSMKPLYLLTLNDDIYFASEIKQLLSFVSTRSLNIEVVSAYLAQGLLDHTDKTFFEGISKIPPKTNCVICMKTGVTKFEPYWNYHALTESAMRDGVEEFRELFLDSVRIRLRSDVKVGVLLSGGLDSSAIAVAAKQFSKQNLESYSVVSVDGKYSEEPFVDALCQAAEIKNRKFTFQIPDVLNTLEEIVYFNDEPFATFSPIAHFKILQLIKQETDVTVLLSGQGGDETMLGYSKFFFFYVQELARNGAYLQAAMQLLSSFLKRTVVRQFRLSEAKRYIRFWGDKQEQHFLRFRHKAERIWECKNLRDRQIADLDLYSVPALAHYEDRMPMAHSLELRHPFLDHRLVNFLVNLPNSEKISGGWTKFVLRQAMAELPSAIRWRKDKQGFAVPEELWLKRDLSNVIKEMFQRSTLAELGVIDDKEFLRYYEAFQNGAQIWYTDITRTFLAEIWAKRFLNNTGQALKVSFSTMPDHSGMTIPGLVQN